MSKGVRHLALGMALSFFVLSLGLVYWQVVEADTLLANPANRRLILLEERVERGGIFDRNGEVLAQTQVVNGKKARVYPQGEVMEPLVGYETLQHGAAGLEGALGDWLLGLKDATLKQKVEQTLALARQGDNVVLTLDAKLQKIAYDGLQGKTGAAVAIDPRTGEILALVSQPSFDASNLDQDWEKINAKSGSPFLNHAFSLFPPGSTMKVVTSAALFRSSLDTTELYNCTGTAVVNGQIISEPNGKAHGWVNYNMALADSCNTYFATHAVEAGDENFLKAAQGFGFGQKIPFELPVQQSRITNAPAIPEHLDENLLAASAFGQGEILVSPFHMALIAAGIANKGTIMTPRIVDYVLSPDQDILHKSKATPWLTALSPDEAAKLTSAMVTAVNEGTAAPGALPGIQVAGKTGSAEPGGEVRSHAWYMAFAPADNPRIAVAVLVENGGTGGGAAAPIAREIIRGALSEEVGGLGE